MEHFDESKLSSINDCPRKFYFEWRLCIEPTHKSFALEFGTLYHDVMALLFMRIANHGSVTGAIEPKVIQEWKECALQEFAAGYVNIESNGTQGKNLDIGIRILENYFDRRGYEYGKVLSVEDTILDSDLCHAAKIDLITESLDGNTIYIIDHKTTSRLDKTVLVDTGEGSTAPNKWKQNRAFIGYRYQAERLYPGKRYVTIVNIAHCIKTKPEFYRVEFEIPRFRVDEWEENTISFIDRIYRCDADKHYPKTGGPCNNYNWGCAYLSLCDRNLSLDKMIIDSSFKKKDEWYC